MSANLEARIKEICATCGNDRTRMMDIVRAVQEEFGCVSTKAAELIAQEVGTARVEVESVVTFYAFLSEDEKGKVVIRLCDDIVDKFKGVEQVAEAFEKALGIKMGETTEDGKITLEWTPCIGLSDQAPAALINEVPVNYLNSDVATEIAGKLKAGAAPASLVDKYGSGNNADPLVKSMVINNLRKRGPVVFHDQKPGAALKKALAMTSAEVIRDLKTARLRGRGGAGFPTGMKWDFTRMAAGDTKYILCNADEGEPGTFKDRVILTERADAIFEGMTIAGYAVGSETGIMYLRAEYAYLLKLLESVLAKRREKGLLGENICGKDGFNFDIRIQMGAGAYVCGEETALISSCEGLRGDPKNRPPFPAQKGYLGAPTVVNNVETFCCVTRILEEGPGWFAEMGSKGSPGTKVLSISGDCRAPGVFEVPFGISVKEMLELAGAEDAAAVQIGGPSGQLVGPELYDRTICYDDLATGGSVMVFGPDRNVLEVADYFMDFFIEESCGYCTPCRVGNVLLKEGLDRFLSGKAEAADIEYLEELGKTVKTTSRCGLGQTSPNPVLTTIKNFRAVYESKTTDGGGDRLTFDLAASLTDAEAIAGRKSVHATHE